MAEIAGKEYKARSKTVQKMSHDGLLSENLENGTIERLGSEKKELPKVRTKENIRFNRSERSEEKDTEEDQERNQKKRKQRNMRKHVAGEPSERMAPSVSGENKRISLDDKRLYRRQDERDAEEIKSPEKKTRLSITKEPDRNTEDENAESTVRQESSRMQAFDSRSGKGVMRPSDAQRLRNRRMRMQFARNVFDARTLYRYKDSRVPSELAQSPSSAPSSSRLRFRLSRSFHKKDEPEKQPDMGENKEANTENRGREQKRKYRNTRRNPEQKTSAVPVSLEEEDFSPSRIYEYSSRSISWDDEMALSTPDQEQPQKAVKDKRKKKQVIQAHAEGRKKQALTDIPLKVPSEGLVSENTSEEKSGNTVRNVPSRMEHVREHLYTEDVETGTERKKELLSHQQKKRQVAEHARPKPKSEEQDLEDFRDEIEKKHKRNQVQKQSKKKLSRLRFDDEGVSMAKGADMGFGKQITSTALSAVHETLREKGNESSDGNYALEAASQGELLTYSSSQRLRARSTYEMNGRHTSRRLRQETKDTPESKLKEKETVESRLKEKTAEKTLEAKKEETEEKIKKVKHFWQKRKYKEAYAAAKEGKKTAESIKVLETVTVKARKAAQEIFRRNASLLISICVMGVLFGLMATSMSSCAALIQGSGTTVIGTTYAATDEEIYAVENVYSALEQALNAQINSLESQHEGYGEYRYQIDEISHNPYHLISYFTTKYGAFTYEQVKEELEQIFREQYGLATESQQETVTETKTVRVGESIGQVVTSGYCNCSLCCGVWAGGPTASGAYPTSNHTIAVDAYHPFLPMGTHVVMNGIEYVVEDTGAFYQYGVQFDVYYDDHNVAENHGHQTWDAYIADSNGTNEVQVTTTQEINRLSIILSNYNLDLVLRNRLTSDELKRYDLYNTTYGNRDYLFDLNTLPIYGSGGGFGYTIPAEALSDQKFANMIHEAEKYLGYPYVWGGSTPSTSFDCSGFVSWVLNNCGNGWNVGRDTADGLRSYCAYVSPSQAKPGDIIFFQGTYNTPGASHVGIYVGNGMMIHCGNPIQYASIETPYWQQHFMAFGRLN